MRFSLGRVVATPGALRALEKAEQLPAEFLDRHVNGDWGNVPEADKQENEFSIEHGFRILSAYTTSAGEQIWILTEADRSTTTISPTTPLYLALCLTPLPMREIGAVIAPLPPGDEHEDLVNAIPPQG